MLRFTGLIMSNRGFSLESRGTGKAATSSCVRMNFLRRFSVPVADATLLETEKIPAHSYVMIPHGYRCFVGDCGRREAAS